MDYVSRALRTKSHFTVVVRGVICNYRGVTSFSFFSESSRLYMRKNIMVLGYKLIPLMDQPAKYRLSNEVDIRLKMLKVSRITVLTIVLLLSSVFYAFLHLQNIVFRRRCVKIVSRDTQISL